MSRKGSPAQRDLTAQLEELRERYHRLGDDELFVLWLLIAYLTEDEQAGAQALTGGSRDKGVDAILIDDAAKCVHVIQSKYRQQIGQHRESRNDVLSFARLSETLVGEDGTDFRQLVRDADDYASSLLQAARKKLRNNSYRLSLYYATLGRVSRALAGEASGIVRRSAPEADIEVLEGHRIMTVLRDYLDGVAPPIPVLELPIEAGSGVRVGGILQRFDAENKIESWVLSMRGDAVAELYEKAGIRLFARNIRGFVGPNTPVNRAISNTLSNEADKFFYYNNGITIVCDLAERRSSKGQDALRVSNPQVINGQQTSRILAAESERSSKASVLVKVIQVPRITGSVSDTFDDLVSRIVAGTNWQNQISASDLMANDRRQIEIERAFRKLGYAYLRKKQTKGETRRQLGGWKYHPVKKEELAQAVAGCELDPIVARLGKDNLFSEENYPRVFPNNDPDYYLPRYWLFNEVTYRARGYPQRGYMKWLVLGFVWSELSPVIRGRRAGRAFWKMVENTDDGVNTPLGRAVNLAYVAALRYYNMNRGVGETATDISAFFKNKKGRNKDFETHWNRHESERRRRFRAQIARIRSAVQSYDG